MNFFEHQQRAQRKTTRLIILYSLAVLLTFLAIHFLVIALTGQDPRNPEIILADFAAVALVVGGGTLWKISQLKSLDGDGVAQIFGGVQIRAESASPKEKRLLNIVEEMALASGISVPNVYVLRNEPSINAFAAGYSQATSVVAVTQGTLDYLNRDELQGVVAHEFSHILHQDTRLDMKLIGILFGLEALAVIGFVLFRIAPQLMLISDTRSDRDEGASTALAIMLVCFCFGLGLILIGLIGQLFANIIRAAISRQREFLADASAVQYTRNPAGISGALQKIGGAAGSRITASKANTQLASSSHIFFGNALSPGFFSHLFDSHPNLTTRIKRIDPSFNGEYPQQVLRISDTIDPYEKTAQPSYEINRNSFARESFQNDPAAKAVSIAAATVLNDAGNISEKKLQIAGALLEQIPPSINDAVAAAGGASAILFAILLDEEPDLRTRELEFLRRQVTPDLMVQIGNAAEQLKPCSDAVKIPILQKAFPALKMLKKEAYLKLREIVIELMKSDGKIDLLEFTIAGFIIGELDLYFRLKGPSPEKYHRPNQIAEPFRVTASAMAYAGSSIAAESEKAFSDAAREIGLSVSLLPQEECTLANFRNAVGELACTSFPLREKILKSLYACIIADGYINEKEGELLRAVTAYFRVPMPTWE